LCFARTLARDCQGGIEQEKARRCQAGAPETDGGNTKVIDGARAQRAKELRRLRGNAPRPFHEYVSRIGGAGWQTSSCELAESRVAAGAIQQVLP
jgi:hypothetical protein